MKVHKAYHHPIEVQVTFDDGSVVPMSVEQYDAFLEFAMDRVDEKLASIREIVN